jgi:hypothetical protein
VSGGQQQRRRRCWARFQAKVVDSIPVQGGGFWSGAVLVVVVCVMAATFLYVDHEDNNFADKSLPNG